MKIEKLELLLNKVVEFNQPNVALYKGFLYKDANGYYIKVVESETVSLHLNDIIYLKEGDEQFIVQAEKPKLMRVSLKSWHYRLMKYVLGSKAPTPKTLQNGCPYFWLLVFCIPASFFLWIWQGFKLFFDGLSKLIELSLKLLVDSWMKTLDDAEAYECYYNGKYSSSIKTPQIARIYFHKSDDAFLDYFINEKYGLSLGVNQDLYVHKKEEMYYLWEIWLAEIKEKRRLKNDKAYEAKKIREEKFAKQEAKREANRKLWDARMKPIKTGFTSLFYSIDKVFESLKFKGDWKILIRRTKQVVGAILTVGILAVTFLLVNAFTYLLIAFIDWSIANWYIYVGIIALLALCGIVYVLYVVLGSWLQSIVNRYKLKKRVWYIEPFIYLLWYPVKYISMTLAYGAMYVLWVPVKFIFYTFLWKIVLVNLGKLIWRGLCSFGRGLANSTGVFGEYFGASYSDYCPGIEWVDTETEE